MKKSTIKKLRSIYFFLILTFILIVLSIGKVNADSFGNFQQNQPANLMPQCQNSTYLNISKIYTNTYTYLDTETITTKTGNVYNYTFTNTSELKTYYVYFHCDLNAIDTPVSSYFIVSTTGTEINQSQGLIYIIMFIGLLLIFIITIYGAIKFPWKNPRDDEDYVIGLNDLKYVKVVLWVCVYLELLFIVSILKNISGSFLPNEGTFYFFQTIYLFMLIGLLPFFPLLIFFTIVLWLSDKKTQKMLQRGLRVK